LQNVIVEYYESEYMFRRLTKPQILMA